MFERVVPKEVKFLLIVHGFGSLNEVAFHVFFGELDPSLNVLSDEAGRLVGVGTGLMADPQIEFESLGNRCFQGGNSVEKIDRFRPRFRMGVVNQGLSVEREWKSQCRVIIVGFGRHLFCIAAVLALFAEQFSGP